jgi:hypothetical protein
MASRSRARVSRLLKNWDSIASHASLAVEFLAEIVSTRSSVMVLRIQDLPIWEGRR